MIYKPSKLFPCDCMGEGIAVTQFYDDDDISEGEVKVSEDIWQRRFGEAPYIQLSFWEYGVCKKPHWSFWWRLKVAWHVFRKGTAWPDQVIMKAAVAKNLANHILYIIGKADKEIKLEEKQPPLVPEEPHPMYCVQHGGSAAGEKVNREHEFGCPRCVANLETFN